MSESFLGFSALLRLNMLFNNLLVCMSDYILIITLYTVQFVDVGLYYRPGDFQLCRFACFKRV